MRVHGEELDILSMRDLVEARASNGRKPFLHLRGETLTYSDADILSNRYADALRSLGVEKGTVVGTFMYNSVAHVLIWFACAKLGAVWAPLNVSLGPTDLRYSLNDCEAQIVIVDEELLPTYAVVRDQLPHVRREMLVGTEGAAQEARMVHAGMLAQGADVRPSFDIAHRDPAAIVYTGGSTGAPKGVLVPQLYFISVGMRYRDVAKATADDVMYECGHLFHSGGQGLGVAGPMFSSMTSVMLKWFSVSKFWPSVKEHDTTVLHVPGTMLGPILNLPESGEDRRHAVRIAIGVGTAQVRREIRDAFEGRFGIRLLEVYAQTEMGVLLCSERIDEPHRPGSSGHSNGWATMAIVDEDDVLQAPRTIGEIVARPLEPYSFMLCYVNKPEQTITTERNWWHHTGDLGYLDEDGNVYLVGRQAHWIRRRSENVSAVEVEAVLAEHPAVAECAVVGVPAEIGDEEIKAYVRLRSEHASLDPVELARWCADRLASFKVPRYVEYVAVLPRTATKGEIERATLKARGIGDAWDRTAVPGAVTRTVGRSS